MGARSVGHVLWSLTRRCLEYDEGAGKVAALLIALGLVEKERDSSFDRG